MYPPKLTLGPPKRHHVVIYLHAKLHRDYTAEKLTAKVKVDPVEVGACAWFDLEKIKAIVSVVEGEGQKTQGNVEKYSKEKIRYVMNPEWADFNNLLIIQLTDFI